MKMQIRLLLVLIISLSLFISCKKETEKVTYSRMGISFIIPEGWRSEDDSVEEGEGWFVTTLINGDENTNDGFIIISLMNDPLDEGETLEEVLNEEVRGEKSNIEQGANKSRLRFKDISNATFNSIPARAISYTYRKNGYTLEGRFYAFIKNNKLVSISFDYYTNVKEKSEKSFQEFEKSFKFK